MGVGVHANGVPTAVAFANHNILSLTDRRIRETGAVNRRKQCCFTINQDLGTPDHAGKQAEIKVLQFIRGIDAINITNLIGFNAIIG